MKADDFLKKYNKYSATVKVKVGSNSTSENTVIFADNMTQARALLQATYGEKSVISVNKI